jgi:benzoylformate decarboxylase
MKTVKDTTIDFFRTYGLKTWFGNPDSSGLALLQDLPHDFAYYYLGLQEMVPVAMADGYAQVTGRPSWLTSIQPREEGGTFSSSGYP